MIRPLLATAAARHYDTPHAPEHFPCANDHTRRNIGPHSIEEGIQNKQVVRVEKDPREVRGEHALDIPGMNLLLAPSLLQYMQVCFTGCM